MEPNREPRNKSTCTRPVNWQQRSQDHTVGKGQFLQQKVLRNGAAPWQRVKLNHHRIPHANQLQVDRRPERKTWDHKRVVRTHRQWAPWHRSGRWFLNLTPKPKMNKWHQIQKVLHSKGNRRQTEKATYWMGEHICKSCVSDKRLISQIYKELIKCNRKNQRSEEKWAEDLNRHFSRCKDDQQVREKILNLINYQKMRIKTTIRHQFTPVGMASIKKTRNNQRWQGCGEKGTLCIAGGNAD